MEDSTHVTTIMEISKQLESAGSSVVKLEQLINSLYKVPVDKNILKITNIGKTINRYALLHFAKLSNIEI